MWIPPIPSPRRGSSNTAPFAGKEYSKADSRYASRDSFTICMEALTAFLVGPLCFVIMYGMLKRKSWRHTLQIVAAVGQVYGDLMYFATSWYEGIKLPLFAWKHTLQSYGMQPYSMSHLHLHWGSKQVSGLQLRSLIHSQSIVCGMPASVSVAAPTHSLPTPQYCFLAQYEYCEKEIADRKSTRGWVLLKSPLQLVIVDTFGLPVFFHQDMARGNSQRMSQPRVSSMQMKKFLKFL